LGGFTTEMMLGIRGRDVAINDVESDWYIIRRRVLERDHYACQRCGISEKKCCRSLDVHHIIPVRKGGLDELNNLITTCPKCHPSEEAKSRPQIKMVERTFHIPEDIDKELKITAAKDGVRFSQIAESAIKD
jgi:HNH endonuclease